MKILVIQQKMIGDVLTSSILFEALRKTYPEASLHYLIYPHTRAVVEHHPHIDELISYDPKKNGKPQHFLGFLRWINKQQYQVVIDVYSKISSGLITRASGAPVRIAYHKKYTCGLYTHTITRRKQPATLAGLAIENRMLLLNALAGDFPETLRPRIFLTPEEKTQAARKIEEGGIDPNLPLLMIGVLGSSASKTYPLEYMARILDQITDTTDAMLLFNYIPRQQEEVERLYALCSPQTQQQIALNIFGRSLREFLALTTHCQALIGNEGGAVNMAKALDIPTFSIFSPQISREAWGLFEDQSHQSVHLRDFRPDLDHFHDPKAYKDFLPELIHPRLKVFLQNHL